MPFEFTGLYNTESIRSVITNIAIEKWKEFKNKESQTIHSYIYPFSLLHFDPHRHTTTLELLNDYYTDIWSRENTQMLYVII